MNSKKQPLKISSPIFLIATVFGIGKIPFMPGTFGALIAALEFTIYLKLVGLTLIFPYLIHICIFLLLGVVAAHYYCKNTDNEDPSEVVIDEYVGQYIAQIICFIFCSFYIEKLATSYLLIIISFLFFRLFDIGKIGIVGYCDKNIKGAVGIILDDVVAAIIASAFAIISLILINLFFYA